MIVGIGVDNIELTRIEKALTHPRFIEKVLRPNEKAKYESFDTEVRKIEFLAGRWAAKEAFSKAVGLGIGSDLHFLDLEIINNELGNPSFLNPPFVGNVQLSISHSRLEATAIVILEKV
ncbi:MAG TPA: holo-ACP synthase [Lactovum miscens]|uniref:holo-ACP synthase n=1 Tax=Lactovum miscens TaxID=190387 RepID=UPI002EDB7C28